MNSWIFDELTRRDFIKKTALTGAAAYLGIGSDYGIASAEPPPETATIRFQAFRPTCWVPQLVAEPLLHKEGFKDIQYSKHEKPIEAYNDMIAGKMDFTAGFASSIIRAIEPGNQLVFIAGLHAGCYSLIASDKIKTVRGLKGKKVWAWSTRDAGPVDFFKSLVAYVGLDPDNDIQYVEVPNDEALELFKRGKIDAFMSFPPGPQQLKAAGIGHTLVDTNVDRPWSQYFCCMIIGRRDFIRNNPVATKKVLRSILTANDMVSQDPEMAAQLLVDMKLRKGVDQKYLAQAFREIPYDKWRHYSPEDTIHFYGLKLREFGATEYSPNEIISKNTDWSYLKSLKNELGITW